ncbi:hypothetical protein [Oricola cellulosilytica]|uniref:C-type lysozyme inhibitor domain-containing protein n=1 Tax=Oricola cellulosilytica TaxID=1429082 RepID=A0A4R0PJS3_9HYPH|nr:hypothetical protein [Oricola cellulosilytica]TCD15919.1 hypothetical protein E0D97_00310 [Oricola cellulosilytica]
MTMIRAFILGTISLAATACQTYVGSSAASYAPVPRQASYRCGDGVDLMIRRDGSAITVTDSRGIAASVPASPPGQSTRFAEGIYALILEGRNATWFVSGQTPVECRR